MRFKQELMRRLEALEREVRKLGWESGRPTLLDQPRCELEVGLMDHDGRELVAGGYERQPFDPCNNKTVTFGPATEDWPHHWQCCVYEKKTGMVVFPLPVYGKVCMSKGLSLDVKLDCIGNWR
jgi:hypothetical protein